MRNAHTEAVGQCVQLAQSFSPAVDLTGDSHTEWNATKQFGQSNSEEQQ